MARDLMWQYHLVWTPGAAASEYRLTAVSSAGHRNHWLTAAAPPHVGTPAVQDVMEELYRACMEFIERTAG